MLLGVKCLLLSFLPSAVRDEQTIVQMLCSQVQMSSELSWMYLRHIHLRRLL